LEKELIPFIDGEYRTEPQDRALVGWSLGGLFGIYTILKNTRLFKRVVAISPSLYWGNQVAFEMLKEFGQASLPVKLYLCIERPDADPLLLEYLEEIKAFAEQLAKCPEAYVKYQVFDGENHFTIGPIGMTRGLVEIYTA
jgi:predicted alpha/beta superfamily hydrolase